jgi:23S rRNA (guanosine2251-2'-O)-methyltransferase
MLATRGELLYGRHAVAEALRGRRTAYRLYLAEGVRLDDRVRALLGMAESANVAIEQVPRLLLDDATRGANHQGIALDAAEYPYVSVADIAGGDDPVVVLDHLQDPQNLGTLLRAAEAAGVAGLVIPQDRAVAVTPAVVNASAGAVEHLAVARVPNLARALDELKDAGRWIVGLDAGAGATDLFTTELPTPLVLVIGAEGGGIGPNVLRRCELRVALPMRGRVASLNAASAGAIALFEIVRRQAGAG